MERLLARKMGRILRRSFMKELEELKKLVEELEHDIKFGNDRLRQQMSQQMKNIANNMIDKLEDPTEMALRKFHFGLKILASVGLVVASVLEAHYHPGMLDTLNGAVAGIVLYVMWRTKQ